MDAEKTGSYIADCRKRKQMTQKELADRLGVTNKAVSKWERGQGMPDISVLLELGRVLEVPVEEILRGGPDREQDEREHFGNGQSRMNGTAESGSATASGPLLEIAGETISPPISPSPGRYLVEGTGWALLVLGALCLALQVWYLLKRGDYRIEYMAWWMFYLVNGAALLLLLLGGICVRRLRRLALKPAVTAVFGLLFLANLAAALLTGPGEREIIRLSPGLSGHCMVLKIREDSGAARLYRPAAGPFVRPAEELPFTVAGEVKTQWLERDVCAVTYESEEDGGVHQFVATYGDRSDGTAYYYVANALLGTWVGEDGYRLDLTDGPDGGIILETPRGTEVYAYEDCLQYGTLALVLPGQGPKWTLVLNRDCVLKSGETTVNDGGTITLCRVSMKDTTPVTLRRVMDGAAG